MTRRSRGSPPRGSLGRIFPLESFDPHWNSLINAALIRAQELEFDTAESARLFQLRFHSYRASVRKNKPLSEAARYVYSVRTSRKGNTLIVYKADEEFSTILREFDPERREVVPPARPAGLHHPSRPLDLGLGVRAKEAPEPTVVEDAPLSRDELFAGLEEEEG